ncbi:MAG: DegV family EDD domain-containing protein [Lachnospiraceae bacterium]|nr:DegV family EDD domain-containing protein [Lachnospiraceae bacterium]
MKKRITRLKESFLNYIYDHTISLKDRSFAVFAFCIVLSILVAMVNALVRGEDLSVIPGTALGGILYVAYVVYEVTHKHLKRARIVSSVMLCFVMMPLLFFTQGGLHAGAPIVMLVNGYFIIMILEGRMQKILCSLNGIVTLTCFFIAHYNPRLVTEFRGTAGFYNMITQFVLAVFELTVMVAFQTGLILRETREAEEKTAEMERLNKSQSRFFASMSHEIRTPINTVLGLNEIILRQEDASEEIRRDARNIQGAGRMLLALINDILDVSKIEAGKMDIVPVNYNVASLLSEIVNMIWLKAEEKGLQFKVDVDPEVPEMLFGDEVRIKQILINLLNNAVKYTKEGSVTLHVECDLPGTETALLKISVEDTGMGIKQEALPDLFDSFRRVDEEKNRNIEGTGLGLSLVKQLVDLMGGEITVNSVYTQGSIFTVTVKQGIASARRIGDISITNAGSSASGDRFQHSFQAPEARILIVDDNEMNLQVERKLLDGTEMTVDLALSGADALILTLRHRYDVIFMDHLMPEMDGIKCYEQIRGQKGGLNNNTPVIVLTANAGGENIELYNLTGFDGYLVKPVSGRQLEEMILTHLPADKVLMSGDNEMTGAQINTASGYAKKRPVAVVTSSMSDLPESIRRELQIDTLPYCVTTGEGVFFDNIDIDSEELVRYMGDEHRFVTSDPPAPEAMIRFFSEELKKAHHLIYISLSNSSSREYEWVLEAAKTFENVTIVNSEYLSSGTGILVMIAARLALQNQPVDRILAELEEAKERINCSFVIKGTDIMARRGHLSPFVNSILTTLWLRPVLRVKNGKLGVGQFLMGSERKCYENYIRKEFSGKSTPDTSFAFITYVGMNEEDLVWIEEMVKERGRFEHVVFQKASAGIASNCGAGTFGVLYLDKGDRDYHLGALFQKIGDEEEQYEAGLDDLQDVAEDGDAADAGYVPVEADTPGETGPAQKKWYEEIPEIDAAAALKNSGSEESFLSVLKIYHDSYEVKSGEIRKYYEAQDWENYTIKVHALKSGSRLVGALQVGEEAEALEMAGKRSDEEFIKSHHDALMADYRAVRDALEPQFGAGEDLPEIPVDTLEEAYAAMEEFSHAKDFELARMVMDSVKEYRLPEADAARFKEIQEKLSQMDWDAILELVKNR